MKLSVPKLDQVSYDAPSSLNALYEQITALAQGNFIDQLLYNKRDIFVGYLTKLYRDHNPKNVPTDPVNTLFLQFGFPSISSPKLNSDEFALVTSDGSVIKFKI